jgi:hydroxyacyl-ACP dehydratase HTD2-like protein with hotdog domain
LLLAAYAPEAPDSIRRRIWAHSVLQAIETIHVLDEHRHAFDTSERERGIAAEWAAINRLLLDLPAYG